MRFRRKLSSTIDGPFGPNGVRVDKKSEKLYFTVTYVGPAQNPANPGNNPLPWANPANIAFNNKTQSLLVMNHASLTPNPEPLFAVFDVYVNDKAGKLFKNDDD
jgi:hypothetical protein